MKSAHMIVLAGLLVAALPAAAFHYGANLAIAQDQDDSTARQDEATMSGEADFRHYCADCHGEEGRGDGPRAFGLSRPPPNLTHLAKRYSGTFPREHVIAIIDGRETLSAHGSREMPVWGDWFKIEAAEGLGGAEGDEASIRRRIERLVDYLISIQE